MISNFIAIALAAMAVQPAVAFSSPALMAAAARSDEQAVFIPFEPPLAERLVYRRTRNVENNGEVQRSESVFAIEFTRDGQAYIMTISPAAADGSPRETADLPPGLARLRFRVSREATITEMIDEASYWAAIEALLEEDLRRSQDQAAARGALWTMRQARELPLSDRMDQIAQQAIPILYFAGTAVDSTRSIETNFVQNSPVGPVPSTSRTRVESLTEDSLTIYRVNLVSIDQMQAAMDELAEQFGGLPPEYGSRLISSDSNQRFVIDRRTGLARSVRFQDSTISEESGQRRSNLVSIMIERVM